MRYEIIIKPSAEKGLDAIPRRDRQRIADALEQLRGDPRPVGVVKLAGVKISGESGSAITARSTKSTMIG